MKKYLFKKRFLKALLAAPVVISSALVAGCTNKPYISKPPNQKITINPTLSKTINTIYNDYINWQITATKSKDSFAYYLNDANSKYHYSVLRKYALTMFGFKYSKNIETDFDNAVKKDFTSITDYGDWKNKESEFQTILEQNLEDYCTFLFVLMICYDKQRSSTQSATASSPYSGSSFWGSYLNYISSDKSLNLSPNPHLNILNLQTISTLNQSISLFFNKPKESTGALESIFLNNADLNLNTATIKFSNLSANDAYAPTNPSDTNPSKSINPYDYSFSIDFKFKNNDQPITFITHFQNSTRIDDPLLSNRLVYLISSIYFA